jgi:hypothetical protein
MIVEIQNNEILVRVKMGTGASKIQSILDYLKYEELTSKSTANEQDIDDLDNEAKKGRRDKIKKQIGLND